MHDASANSAEYCRARVEESERMAAQAKDPQNKAIFNDLADRWRRLAKESETGALRLIGANRAQRGTDA